MKQRCPDSLFTGLGVLQDYKFIVNQTGYGNIIPSPGDQVYGSLCFLSYRDEKALDESEGVPWLNEKHTLKVRRLIQKEGSEEWVPDEADVEATAYVDVQRQTEGHIEREYVVWIRKSIEDGEKLGMPPSYAEKYLNKYLPSERGQEADIVMIRTRNFGQERNAGLIPKGFASWSRG
jgi:gamma-glutamylcyclotransferase